MTGPRFTALEYLALIGAVNELETQAAESGHEYLAPDVRAANRALQKIANSLTPAQHREVSRRLRA